MESRSRGLILMERAIFFSSSSCSWSWSSHAWHLLPLGLGLFQAFLFLLSLLGLFLVFILPQFFLLFLLLLVELLLLLGSDLLPLGLLLLQLLQLLLLLLPGLSPLIDVLFEGLIESCLGCCLVLPIRGHNSFTTHLCYFNFMPCLPGPWARLP